MVQWKNVWITGASSGIGKALATRLDGACKVAISARRGEVLDEIVAAGQTLSSFPLDVTDKDAVARVIDEIETASGPIDLAVLNAGAWSLMDADDMAPDAIRQGIEVNYFGVMHALYVLVPRMVQRGGGHIAIVASVAGYRGLPRSIAYGPTKAALINLAETLQTELAAKGVTISIINPGFVDTPLTEDNPFPMPGMITADAAADHMLSGLKKERFEIAFPFAFSRAMKFLRILPNGIYFFLIKHFVKI